MIITLFVSKTFRGSIFHFRFHNTKSHKAELVITSGFLSSNLYAVFATEKDTSGVEALHNFVTSAFRHNGVMTSTMAPRQINEGFPNLMHAWGEDKVLQVITQVRLSVPFSKVTFI